MKGVTFLIQYSRIMFILFPILLLFLTALALISVHFMRPYFRYSWMIAGGGATLALIGIFLWQYHFPESIALGSWQPVTSVSFAPTWLVDASSWPYALSLVALAVAFIFTSLVRAENHPVAWAGTLLITSLGILAVTAENPLTLILAWTSIDLVELTILLRSPGSGLHSRGVVAAFISRLAGSGMVLWAALVCVANGTQLDFHTNSERVGIYLLFAVGLRMGLLFLQLPNLKEDVIQHRFGTILQLVSTMVTLSLLAKVVIVAPNSIFSIILIILAAVMALFSSWRWIRSSDEISGRPFWILTVSSLSLAACLYGNPTGSIGWAVMLVLAGGLLFLNSARQKATIWLPFLGVIGISALPFTATAAAWQSGNPNSWYIAGLFIPAQTLLSAGFIRHAILRGKPSLDSQERWSKVLYPVGLFLLAALTILLGLWGWDGALQIGQWWAAIISITLVVILTFLFSRRLFRIPLSLSANRRIRFIHFEKFSWLLARIYDFFHQVANIITSSLEGEGGLLWSFLLLALILSVLFSHGW
jgi:hypothetical protein